MTGIYRGDGSSGTGEPVEDLIAGKVNRTGDTMIGALNVPSGATGTEAPQSQEVVLKTGSTMTGDLFSPNVTATGQLTALTARIGDVGTEGSGINIGGVTYESTFKVSDIDGTNYAQNILHRHSTTLEPLIVGARSNSNTSSHADVTAGQGLFSIFAAGWAGSNYKLFGQESFKVGTGTISNTSAPGKWSLSITPDGSVVPVETHYVDSDALLRGKLGGTATNDNAVTGQVGEYLTSTSGSTSLTTATATNLTSISLTAGDWELTGSVYFNAGATTNINYLIAGINSTSLTFQAAPNYAQLTYPSSGGVIGANEVAFTVPQIRFSLAATTTLYIICNAAFTVSTLSAIGKISARRVR